MTGKRVELSMTFGTPTPGRESRPIPCRRVAEVRVYQPQEWWWGGPVRLLRSRSLWLPGRVPERSNGPDC